MSGRRPRSRQSSSTAPSSSRPRRTPQLAAEQTLEQPQGRRPQRNRRTSESQPLEEDDMAEERRLLRQREQFDDDDEEEEEEEGEEEGEEESEEEGDEDGEESEEEEQSEEEEDYVPVSLAEIPPMPARVYNGDYKTGQITVRPPLKPLSTAYETCHDWIRSYIEEKVPNLSFLLSLPTDTTFYGMAATELFHGRLVTNKQNVLWFDFKGFPIRFSKQEFVLCSGLNVRKSYRDSKYQEVVGNTSFADKYFPDVKGSDPVKTENILKAIIKYSIDVVRGNPDRLNNAKKNVMAVLVLGHVMTEYLRGGGWKGLPRTMWSVIADLEFCNNFDWGN